MPAVVPFRVREVMWSAAVGILVTTGTVGGAEDGPLPPGEAAATMTLPEGFRAMVVAAEPDVTQPIAFTFDHRGRLWVVECLSYPEWSGDGPGRDRVLILDDADGDGRFEKPKVFWDRGSNLSGIEVGFGGVWLCSVPNLIFVPDRDGDDRPDGPPETLLDGWDLAAKHNVFNGLTWGPDGWLYGCNGILSNSRVGAPGTRDAERTALNCGVWRYHPTRRVFEVVAGGTTNPWGLDFDALGRMFITNCVIEHVFHVIPGGHYKRMFGQDLGPHVYALLGSCADHIHWDGGFWDTSIGGTNNDYGGGHAHAGAMIYLGDNWPAEYRGGLFTINIHGQRVNFDTLRPRGSGVVASHRPDPILSADPWFRGLELACGPDGGVFLTDWNDTGECHDYEDVERGTGRIFKITHGSPERRAVDLAAASDAELARLQAHGNDWHVRQSRRQLQQRAARNGISAEAIAELTGLLRDPGDTAPRLNALWSLHVADGLSSETVAALLGDGDEHVRAWTIRIELEDRLVTRGRLLELVELARSDPSPVVRLELAAGLQRLPPGDRWPLARALVAHAGDADDANLPLMLWYGIEPLANDPQGRDLALLSAARVPLVQRFLARRVAEESAGPQRLVSWLADSRLDAAAAAGVVRGLRDALEGRREASRPRGWDEVLPALLAGDARDDALFLGLLFNDAAARETLLRTARDTSLSAPDRRRAVETMVLVPHRYTVEAFQGLLGDAAVAGPALSGLAAFNDARTPALILARYGALGVEDRQAAVSALAARETSAVALLDAVASGKVARSDVSTYVARQLAGYGRPEITRRLEALWGTLRATSEEKRRRIADWRARLSPDALAHADLAQGRKLFAAKCANCHKLFNEGKSIGPDLTGAQRTSVDYVLENILDPSAAVPREYRVHSVLMSDGRLLNGVLPEESARTVTLQTPTERLILDRGEIEELKPTNVSMMPEGLLEGLSEEEVRDLVGYLGSARR